MDPSPVEDEANTEIEVPDADFLRMAEIAALICASRSPPSDESKKVSGTQSLSKSHSALLVLVPLPSFEPVG